MPAPKAPTDFRTLDRTFIIAEIGVNHEGDVAVAHDLIKKAATAGADAVKFQTFSIDTYISTVQPERYERTSGFELTTDDFRALAKTAADNGLIFFATPFHMSDADRLDDMAPIFKISSGDLTYADLIEHTASKGRPVIISTGIGTRDEIAAAVNAAKKGNPGIVEAGQLLLMHCIAAYPTPAEEANVRNVRWLEQEFGLPVGYSDHTLGTKACELAVATGAVAVEKHFTYRKEDQAFHDHKLSADPEDLIQLVAAIREAEVYLGNFERQRGKSESDLMAHMRRSVGAHADIKAGTPITADQLVALRPAWGVAIETMNDLVGKTLKRDVAAGDLIKDEDVAG